MLTCHRSATLLTSRQRGLVTHVPQVPALRVQHAGECRQRLSGIACAQAGKKKPPIQQMLVYVPPHPLVKHWLAIARNASTPNAMFRAAVAELGRVLIYEAVREFLPTVDAQVETPMGPADVTFVDPTKPVKVVPILRAGLVLLEQAQQVLPAHEVYHVGYVRDEHTLEAKAYLNKLPQRFEEDDRVLITDPMLATGGTIVQVVDDVVARGCKPENVRIVSVVVAPAAMVKLSNKYKGLKVYTACIDAEVNEKGFIIPGLGDAGDRAFGNTKAGLFDCPWKVVRFAFPLYGKQQQLRHGSSLHHIVLKARKASCPGL